MSYKNFLIPATLFILTCASCKKNTDTVFSEPAAQRIEKTLTALNTVLPEPNYWVANIFTGASTGNAYSFYLDFEGNNRVKMLSDISNTTASVLNESSYSTKWLQQPTLLFDTYNYVHWLVDPVPGTNGLNGQVAGKGLISDFEFGLSTVTTDTLNMDPSKVTRLYTIGRYNGTPVTFRKIGSDEVNYWTSGGIKNLRTNVIAYLKGSSNLYTQLSGNNEKQQIQIDTVYKTLSFIWVQSDSLVTKKTSYVFSFKDILLLKDTINFNGKLITALQWNNGSNTLSAIANGTATTVYTSSAPVLPLSVIIGISVKNINVPNATSFPGWSSDFTSRRASAAAAMLAGPYTLRMGQMQFNFLSSSIININLDIYQGSTKFLAQFAYTALKSSTGTIKFTPNHAGDNGNASLIVNNMAPILVQRIDADNFTLDYYNDPTYGVLGKFTSVEHPDFYFTGTF